MIHDPRHAAPRAQRAAPLGDEPAPAPAPPPAIGAGGARRQGSVARRSVERVVVEPESRVRRKVRDQLAVEEPLEIVLAPATPEAAPRPLAVTMRTPGADFDLVAGYLYGEGAIDGADQILAMRYCPGGRGAAQLYNRVEVRLAEGAPASRDQARLPGERRGYTTSSCGVCGADSIEAVLRLACPPVRSEVEVGEDLLLSLPDRLRGVQALFERTGGLHAAALFDLDGKLRAVREDIGRHNALDKLVGSALRAGEMPFAEQIVLLSGRLGFELVQKAARAGVAVLAGVSAPSSLAVELAERVGMTLVGFLRPASFNVYSGGARVRPGSPGAAAARS